jgi:hypothetical protein
MSTYQLAQLNIANMKAPLESPSMADFGANLQRINALAEASPGYIWRFQDEAGDATAFRPFGDDMLVNLSVWRDVQALSDYTSTHPSIPRCLSAPGVVQQGRHRAYGAVVGARGVSAIGAGGRRTFGVIARAWR